MKKGINKGLLLIILGILLIGSGFGYHFVFNNKTTNNEKEENKPVGKEKITPLMYEVTKEGSSNKIYLFGTIHVSDLKEENYPSYVIDAYKDSDIVSPEFNILEIKGNMQKTTEYVQKMMLNDGTQLKDHLSEKVYNNLIALLKDKNVYSFTYEYLKPYTVQSILTDLLSKDAKINGNVGVDEFFLKKATEDKKEIIDVESADYQLDLMESIPEQTYELIIKSSLADYQKEVLGIKMLYSAWKQGDSAMLSTLLGGSSNEEIMKNYSDEEKELIKDYYSKTIYERNASMKDKLVELFDQDKKVFFMVGTAHIVGENGVANLLEKEGFTVTQVNK